MSDIQIIHLDDANYPQALKDLKDPPKQIYIKGNLSLLEQPLVSIVGTRDCTRYGLMIAKEIATQCVAAGFVVVSGLAEGIDTAAHQGAGLATIAVLGNGIDVYYPAVNKDLQNTIAENGGLLISEYPPNLHGGKTTFPQRNRIVAALGQAVIAVEADLHSGTLITVKIAKSLQRDVYAVPGNINCYASQGTNDLIAHQQAIMVTSPTDLVQALAGKRVERKVVNVKQISLEQQNILNILKTDEVHFDEIIIASGLSVAQLSTLLTNMEMIGLIEKLPGNYFVAK